MYNVITATFNALGKSYIPLVFLFCSNSFIVMAVSISKYPLLTLIIASVVAKVLNALAISLNNVLIYVPAEQ